MTAVNKVFRAEAEPAAADRPLPKSALDASGRSVFYRQLQQITELVREASELEQVMGEVSPALCKLFNADRLTLYGLDEDRKSIISKFKSGLASKREIKLPISAQSIAGYAALSHSLVNLADVYDKEALRQIHPDLKFLQEVDRRTGYQTREMLVAPILENGELFGVLQIINSLSGQKFDELVVEGVQHLCKALAVAFHFNSLDSLSRRRIYTSKYSGLVIDGILTAEELQKCVQDAREAREPVERLLINRFQVSAAQIGSSLSKFFGVRYQPFNPGSIRSEMMHSALKRDFVQEQGWLPLEDSPDGLVILCLDPEATRGARLVPQVFPRHGKFDYRVTTQLEFEQTVDLLFEIHAGSIDQLLADLGEPLVEEEAANESALESAASDNELVKFVNKVIVDAYHQRASDIHVEPLPGKAKTGIRFRIDGTLMPYIEVPAQFRQALVTRLKIMCDLDIAERRRPQDGKIKFKKFGPLDIELRVATIPSAGGVEDVVMRILAGGEPIPLENLGLSPNNRKRLDLVITKPYGLFYVCGPTGSGKTTTLHSILKILNTTEAKIWTAEDP
ncbi:MAG: ATPase, T2SS/T4P/T4SS family, partial [Hylemonella sp.]